VKDSENKKETAKQNLSIKINIKYPTHLKMAM
jgi:hypothetical protein